MIYSPTQTKSYLSCPQKRQYQNEGLRTRTVPYFEWCGLIGTAIHTGLEYYNDRVAREGDELYTYIDWIEPAILAGQLRAQEQWDEWVRYERQMPDAYSREAACAWVRRAVPRVIAHGIPAGYAVIEAEHALADYGPCILDLHLRAANGKPTFCDYKVKLKLEADKVALEEQRWGVDWQMLHDVWALQQYTKEMLDTFHVCLIVLQPTLSVRWASYRVDQQLVAQWARSATSWWDDMQVNDEMKLAPMSNTHFDYGRPCEYYDACFLHHGDRAQIQTQYITIPRKRGVTDAS
jgi:hypothetical protein